jgi:signal transduction histidine kinase
MSDMFHRDWTIRDGAPLGINAIAQTADGFLWLGTDDGLYRFDGVSFQHYMPPRGGPILSAVVADIVAVPDGSLWVGYPTGGVSHLNQGHNRNYGVNDGLPSGYFVGFAQDRQGNVWATNLTGLFRLHGDRWQQIAGDWDFRAKFAGSIFVDSRGTLWVGTEAGLFSLRDRDRKFRLSATLKGGVNDIAEGPDGTIWVGLWDTSEIRAAVDSSGRPVQNPTVIHVQTGGMTFAADKTLWIPTKDNGLFRIRSPLPSGETFNVKSAGIEHFSKENGLSSNLSFASLEDRERSIWVFTGAGIDQFRRAAFTPVAIPSDFNRIALLADDDGVLAGSESVVKIREGKPEPFGATLKGVTCFYRDPQGTTWVGTEDGLQRSTQSRQFAKIGLPDGLNAAMNPVQSLTMDREGTLWVSIIKAGIYRFAHGEWSRARSLPVAPQLSAIVETTDSKGQVWFGLRANKILMLDQSKVTTYGPDSGVNVGNVTAIVEHAGRLWVGGEAGLEFVAHGKFVPVRLAGTSLLRVTGVIQTSRGDLWINQASGVIHIDASEVALIETDNGHYANSTLFNYLDGLGGAALQQRPLPTAVAAVNGKLYFATRAGVFWVDPLSLPHNLHVPSVSIDSVRADTVLLREPASISLAAGTKNLQIDYSSPSLQIPERVRFRYRLEGYDQGWQDAGTRRQAFYSRVPPGSYTFHVIASNDQGVWNETGTSLPLTLTPSFTETTSFKGLCLLFGLCGLWLIYRLRIRQAEAQITGQLHERLAERERIARDLHDTFFQSIQGLLLRFHTGTRQLRTDEPARYILEEALDRSDQVMLEGRELVLDLRTGDSEEGSLANSFAASGKRMQDIYSADFKVITSGSPRALHPIVYDEVTALGKEALYNAFRHANAQSIEAEVSFETGRVCVRVRDDGSGIDPCILKNGQLAGHWGLPGMRERAKKLGAELHIWSGVRSGTEIELRVPAAVAYKEKSRLATRPLWARLFKNPEELS